MTLFQRPVQCNSWIVDTCLAGRVDQPYLNLRTLDCRFCALLQFGPEILVDTGEQI